MALRVLFDQYDVPISDWGRSINFKIYDEFDNPFNCTFATGGAVVKTFDRNGNQFVNDINVTWDTKASGIGHFAYTYQYRPSKVGPYYLCVQMWDSASPPVQQTSTTLRRIVFSPSPSEF